MYKTRQVIKVQKDNKFLNQAVTSFPDADMALYYIYEMNYMYVTHILRPYKVFYDCHLNIYGHSLDTKPVTIFCPRCMHVYPYMEMTFLQMQVAASQSHEPWLFCQLG